MSTWYQIVWWQVCCFVYLIVIRVRRKLDNQVSIPLVLIEIMNKPCKDRPIEPPGLPVCLWMVRCGGSVLRSRVAIDKLKKLTYKLRSVICEAVPWNSKRNDPEIDEQVHNMCRWCLWCRHRKCKLWVTVRDNQDFLILLDCFDSGPRKFMDTNSSGLDTGNRWIRHLWRYLLSFRAQLVHCAVVAYISLVMWGH